MLGATRAHMRIDTEMPHGLAAANAPALRSIRRNLTAIVRNLTAIRSGIRPRYPAVFGRLRGRFS
jgi:hypothetical protein